MIILHNVALSCFKSYLIHMYIYMYIIIDVLKYSLDDHIKRYDFALCAMSYT